MALLLKYLTFKSKNQDISASCMLPRIKNQQDLRNSDLEVYCTNIHPELEKKNYEALPKVSHF